MSGARGPQRIFHIHQTSSLTTELRSFLVDCQARNLSPNTRRYYEQKLIPLIQFLTGMGVTDADQVEAGHLRTWLVRLQNSGHNPGGVHGHYRAMKVFFRWLCSEGVISRCPVDRIRSPRVPDQLLEPASIESVKALLATCAGTASLDLRDRALIMALLDSGCRASEFVGLRLGDLDRRSGAVLIRQAKGGRHRVTFVGSKTLRAINRYLRTRVQKQPDSALFATKSEQPMTYSCLRDIIRRRSGRAGVTAPSLHSFRRAFAIGCLRNGADLVSLQRMMGHSSLTVLKLYLRQSEEDLKSVHSNTAPVDRLL